MGGSGLLAAARSDEGGRDAIDEALPRRFGANQREHHHLEIGVLGRIDHHRPAVDQTADDLLHAIRATLRMSASVTVATEDRETRPPVFSSTQSRRSEL